MKDERVISNPVVRIRAQVRGLVQGVGFRPFVYRLATGMTLGGWVRNIGAGVEIEIEGERTQAQRFWERLRSEAPHSAHIEHIEPIEHLESPETAAAGSSLPFTIRSSSTDVISTSIAPDSALCDDCISEIFDPANRRYRHAFTHCIQCGPRYTIAARLPYDRINTSMAAFDECPACRAEREQPNERRFHAQTNACPDCGPRLWLSDKNGMALPAGDAIAATLQRLMRGEIVAIKGLGGFHLVCDARNAQAVRLLRERKAREEKPFALMLANRASAIAFVDASDEEAALLSSPQRPIVLLKKREGCDDILSGISPGMATLGVMLPTTPIQYLLFHDAAGRPDGTAWLEQPQALALVMTSANPHGEPLITDNRQALAQLASIADAFLMHDRDILIRCDDSVIRPSASPAAPQFVRRARGHVPAPILLARQGVPGIAFGAYLNNTICVARSGEAFVSQHIGDLENRATCEAFEGAVSHLLDILRIEPRWVAADLHPDFHSTRFAHAFAEERGLPLIEVQHHHAHIGAVMAEHRMTGPALGLALDGVGLGSDGTAWGGELLLVDGARCERLAHLQPLALPGGDRAAREPWRMAAAALFALGRHNDIGRRFGPASSTIANMLENGLNTPRTSSAGRLFDAAAGLLGIKPVTSFEGQAAMMLEGLAASFGKVEPMACGHVIDHGILNMMPLLACIADMQDASHAAALFHATLAAALADWVRRAALEYRIGNIVFGGGCFHNRILSDALRATLEADGLHVSEAVQVPPGDGGLSLGQAWVALHHLDS